MFWDVYKSDSGGQVRSGCFQLIPSSSMDSCAWVRWTLPLLAWGQTNRPRSNRLINRHTPSLVAQSTLTTLPRFPRNTNTWPAKGSSSSVICTLAARPFMPERISVTPAANQMRVPAGSPIMDVTSLIRHEPRSGRHYYQNASLQQRSGFQSHLAQWSQFFERQQHQG